MGQNRQKSKMKRENGPKSSKNKNETVKNQSLKVRQKSKIVQSLMLIRVCWSNIKFPFVEIGQTLNF